MLNPLNQAERYRDLAEGCRRLGAFSFSTQGADKIVNDGRRHRPTSIEPARPGVLTLRDWRQNFIPLLGVIEEQARSSSRARQGADKIVNDGRRQMRASIARPSDVLPFDLERLHDIRSADLLRFHLACHCHVYRPGKSALTDTSNG